jgi:hypothetical protein
VAGIVYVALQRSAWVPKDGDAKMEVRKSQGFVGLFLISCLITVWAVFGELWTTWLLVDELARAKGFTPFAVDVFRVLIILGAASLILYTIWRVGAIVWPERAKKPPSKRRKRRVKRATTPVADRESAPPEIATQPAPKVSLL